MWNLCYASMEVFPVSLYKRTGFKDADSLLGLTVSLGNFPNRNSFKVDVGQHGILLNENKGFHLMCLMVTWLYTV